MARRILKPGALTAPLPPVLVSVGDMEKANIITIGWTGILATHPPKTYISVRPERYSYGILKEKKEFVINLAPAALAFAVDYAGIYTGAKVDKFAKCALTAIESDKVAAPSIKECPVSLECKVCDIIPMGTHDVFVADIVSVSCDESIIDTEGRLHFERADLLAYAHGEYFRLGDKVGSFGFSTRKKKPVLRSGSEKEKNTQAKKTPYYAKFVKGKGKNR